MDLNIKLKELQEELQRTNEVLMRVIQQKQDVEATAHRLVGAINMCKEVMSTIPTEEEPPQEGNGN